MTKNYCNRTWYAIGHILLYSTYTMCLLLILLVYIIPPEHHPELLKKIVSHLTWVFILTYLGCLYSFKHLNKSKKRHKAIDFLHNEKSPRQIKTAYAIHVAFLPCVFIWGLLLGSVMNNQQVGTYQDKLHSLYLPLSFDAGTLFTLGGIVISLLVLVNVFGRKHMKVINKFVIVFSAYLFIISGVIMSFTSQDTAAIHLQKMVPALLVLPALLGLMIWLYWFRESNIRD